MEFFPMSHILYVFETTGGSVARGNRGAVLLRVCPR